jgi:hypothetical protein
VALLWISNRRTPVMSTTTFMIAFQQTLANFGSKSQALAGSGIIDEVDRLFLDVILRRLQ